MAEGRLVFSHSRDLDGIASAALLTRCLDKADVRLVDYSNIGELIEGIEKAASRGYGEVYVADLAIAGFYADKLLEAAKRAAAQGVQISWFDHHRPPPELLDKAAQTGIKISLDNSRCSGEIVAELVCGDTESLLAKLARDSDFLMFSHPLAKPFEELIAYYYHKGGEWRLKRLVERLAQGVYWDETIEEDWRNARDAIEEEEGRMLARAVLRDPAGIKMAGSYASTVLPTHTAPLLLAEKTDSDLAVILYDTGEFIIAKRRGVSIDCGRLAAAVGGGGHPHMAGGWYSVAPDLEGSLRKLLSELADAIKNRF